MEVLKSYSVKHRLGFLQPYRDMTVIYLYTASCYSARTCLPEIYNRIFHLVANQSIERLLEKITLFISTSTTDGIDKHVWS